jgi:hypothetical protein
VTTREEAVVAVVEIYLLSVVQVIVLVVLEMFVQGTPSITTVTVPDGVLFKVRVI